MTLQRIAHMSRLQLSTLLTFSDDEQQQIRISHTASTLFFKKGKVNEMELDPFQRIYVSLTIFSEFRIRLISILQMHFLLFIFTFLRVS